MKSVDVYLTIFDVEWPTKAVFAWTWPGLSTKYYGYPSAPGKPYGISTLSSDDPLDNMLQLNIKGSHDRAWGLKVWKHYWPTWLVIDMREPKFYGKLVIASSVLSRDSGTTVAI